MADIGNPIHYGDLFHGDIETGLNGLISKVEETQETLLTMIKEVKKEASSLGSALSGTSSASKGDRDATSQYASEVDRLYAANERLSKSLTEVTKDLESLRRKKSESKGDTSDLAKSYSSLSQLIAETGVNVEELLQSERQLTIAKKNGEAANSSLNGSYNKLYAQYNLIKNVLNAMGEEMRNNEAIGKKWEAQAYSIMNTMKAMQESTGKHTLSVGDYSKALNVLNISTQQVLREMPTLANSVSQFFMAISNNVPIFTDSLERVVAETGSWKIAMKGVLTSILSWQTALLVVLTILPKVAKAIHDKRKAQEEDNKATKKQIEFLHLVHEALLASAKAETENISKIRTLIAITQDYNRTEKDRITAAQVLKQTYDEQLANYSAEQIALGKAKTALDEITKSLVEQAKARALLNKITEAYVGQIESEDKMIQVGKTRVYEYSFQNIKGLYDYVQNLLKTTKLSEEQIRKSIAFASKGDKDVWKQYDAYKAARKEIEEYGKTIDDLTKRIPVAGLLDFDLSGRTKKDLDKSKDYYWEWRESIARILLDEEERAIELNNVKYEHSIANMQAALEEQKAAGNLSVQQEKYLTEIMLNLETERQQKRWNIIFEFYDKLWNQIKEQYEEAVSLEDVGELDISISGQYERLLAANVSKLIASRERLNHKLVSGTFKEAKEEGKIFKNLTIEKLRLEEEEQEKLLKMRQETGEISAEQYEIELAKLQIALGKAIAGLERKRRGKFDLWTIFFGETKEDGKGNVFKELSAEQQMFVSSFQQSMNMAIQYMNEWISTRIEMAQVAVDAAHKESEATKTMLDYEMEARANGYANNVELARREYEKKLELERKAIAEKERLQKIQEAINTATQFSSLVTATAELWAAHASIPIVGTVLAAAATAAMWGSFAAAKITAARMTATKYGDGMSEYLDYGGSHASGNDIDFGHDKHGRQRRVERGEMIGVINKRNVEKYGIGKITDIIQSLNKGTFENKYSSVVDAVSPEMNADLYHLAFAGLEREYSKTDLGGVESSLKTLIEQGETRIVTTPYGRIEYKGNNKRIIRNS